MSYSIDKDLCTGCGSCIETCPAEAIRSDEVVAAIDDDLCILCGACQVNCPQNAVLYDGTPYEQSPPIPFTDPCYIPQG